MTTVSFWSVFAWSLSLANLNSVQIIDHTHLFASPVLEGILGDPRHDERNARFVTSSTSANSGLAMSATTISTRGDSLVS
jgi:hypothetical protein